MENKENIWEKVAACRVIAVLEIKDEKDAVPAAKALIAGGISCIELALRTEASLKAVELIKKNVPEMIVGIGTVLRKDQLDAVSALGADFCVAPGCNRSIIGYAKEIGMPFAPGIMTPSEIEVAVECGCKYLKFFPAESTGGMKHLKSMGGPYSYLGLKYIPLGGLNLGNCMNYLESPMIAAIGGSWIATKALIQAHDWDQITKNAEEVMALAR